MHQVSAYTRSFIRQHLDQHGIVVWYDPEGLYRPLVEAGWEGVKVLHYEGSFLALRRAADEALEAGSTPERLGERFPPLLIYLPLARSATQNALIELETAGVVLGPEERYDPRSDLPRDTRLAALAREALKKHLPPALLEQVVAEVEAGKLGLAELDRLVRPPEVPVGLSTFYQVQTPEAVALAFVTGEDRDRELTARDLLRDLQAFFREHFDMPEAIPSDAARMRAFVVSHLLVTEAAVASGTVEETFWQGLPVVASPAAQALAVKTVQAWRADRNLSAAYRDWVERVEEALALPLADLPDDALAALETFVQGEELLWERLAEALAAEGRQEVVRRRVQQQALARRDGFWAQQDSLLAQGWKALLAAVAVFDTADAVQRVLRKGRLWKVEELVARYADQEDGWHRLDRAYRHFEVAREALLDLETQHSALTRLESAVRRRYRDTVHRMTERLVAAWERRGAQAPEGLPLQRETFRDLLWPQVQERRRVAYVLVDALRYDLLAELIEDNQDKGDFIESVRLEPGLGTLPAITVLGMAALLPGAEGSLGLAEERGDLVAEVDGHPLRTREERIRFLEERLKMTGKVERFAAWKLEDLRSLFDRGLERLKQVDFLLVTSQEIDQVAENLGPVDAYDQFRRVFRDLWRALRRLADAGFEQVVITADHGFLLFGDGLKEAEKVEPPAGETVKVGRRYWIGRGAASGSAYIAFTAADLDLTGDLEFAFPRGAGAFRAAGGHTHYYHGGLSLQEMVVPRLHLRLRTPEAEIATGIVWHLEPASARVTSKVFRVTVRAEALGLFRPPQRVRLEVRLDGKPISPQMFVEVCDYSEMLNVLTVVPPQPGAPYPACEVALFSPDLPESGVLELSLVDADTGARRAGPVTVPIDVAIR